VTLEPSLVNLGGMLLEQGVVAAAAFRLQSETLGRHPIQGTTAWTDKGGRAGGHGKAFFFV
jgi:hypothetical protein